MQKNNIEPVTGRRVKVAIIGAGFGGLAAAIRLLQQNIDDFIIIEKTGDVGGTWRENRYPGAACDVQSHMYSLSFAPKQTGQSVMPRRQKFLNIYKILLKSINCANIFNSIQKSLELFIMNS